MLFHLRDCVGIHLEFETKRRSLVFLSGSNYHAFIFPDVNTRDSFLHRSERSLIIFCSVTSISFSIFQLVSRVE